MARPKKVSVAKIIICSFLCFVVGVVIGSFFRLYYTTPDSYMIPETVTVSNNNGSNTAHEGEINAETVKSNDLSIHFLELGNKYTGDCTFIKIGDVEILVDAGSKSTSVQTIYNYINPYIEGELDYVIVTHAHQDHYAGFATSNSLFDKFEITNVIEFNKCNQNSSKGLYKAYIDEKKQLAEKMESLGKEHHQYKVTKFVNKDDISNREIDLGNNVKLQFLYQKYYDLETATTENNNSVCFQLVQQLGTETKKYMFTGDLEKEGEASLVNASQNAGLLSEVELYKAGHHGSKTSSSKALLEVIKPKTVCVCCCAGSPEYTKTNANQFPTQEFVDNVAKYAQTDKVYVTSLCVDYDKAEFTSMNGSIVICAKAHESSIEINIYCSNNSKLLKETDWFKANRTMPAEWAA